jgi:SAM-dependent methyltransferase
MGIAKEAFFLLGKLSLTKNFEGLKVLQLGRQSGIVSTRQISKISKRLKLNLPHPIPTGTGFYRNYPKGDELFRFLGFTSIDSLDVTDYEGANVIADLNLPISSKLQKTYDLVYDGGTSEHVFNQLEVLSNVHKLLKVGGIIVHNTPANNLLDHGYVQPSPNFYLEYYAANDYELVQGYLIESTWDFFRKRRIFKYDKLAYNYLSYGGHWNSRMLQNWFAFRKTEESTYGKFPQQARYTDLLYLKSNPQPSESSTYIKLRDFFRKNPKLMFFVLQTKHWALKALDLPNRYFSRRRPKTVYKV